MIRLNFCGLLFLGIVAVVGGAKDEAPKTFKQVIEAHFDKWDANHDGKLDAHEIDHLLHQASIKNDEAATVASIHIYYRGHANHPGLTKGELLNTKDGQEERRDKSEKSPHFASDFKSLAKHLNTIPRKVFVGQKIQLDDLSQGHLGDCYFVSVVGAFVHRNPEGLHRIIHEGQANGTEVTFPDGKKAHVPALTDGLICLGSTAHQSGLWLNVLEEAFGEVTRSKKPGAPGDPAIDKIGKGGSQTTTITLLTGKQSQSHSLKSTPPAKVHQILTEAQSRKMLMGAGTGSHKKLPPGVASDHAYAIIGLHGDKVEIWNPWGNKFTPKGTPGLTNGYPTEKGVFTVPLHEFCEIFGDISVETNQAHNGKKR
jgi:phosphoribosylcarboxyaminoimidazole (NCAIR) mutase